MASVKFGVGLGGSLAVVTLNRPERSNAFTLGMLRELSDIVRGLNDSEKVRVVMVMGEGKAFCAGADLKEASEAGGLSTYLGKMAKSFHNVLEVLTQCPAVVLTVVDGPAAGGGFSLAMAGDVRWATPEAKFRVGYGRVGLTVDGGLSWRLPRLIGMAQAQRLLLEDPDIDADEAMALGLVQETMAATDLKSGVQGLVERISRQSRLAVRRNRQLLVDSGARTFAEALEAEAVMLKTSAAGKDGEEGIRAFLEKRPPAFR